MNLNIGSEGSSITRPPFFDGNNYSFWKTRMTIFLQSLDYQLWHIVVNGPRMPTRTIEGVVSLKPENEYNDNDFKMLQLNSKAKHVLFCAVGPNEFNLDLKYWSRVNFSGVMLIMSKSCNISCVLSIIKKGEIVGFCHPFNCVKKLYFDD
ncbi:DUF4219 domain-containing protein [Cephalotus follicularis]|uniref:DUF4219 domain-containing protein n=1 Tax=Cephalotus follicularis TaxID=3775 RepID=A0A1Q3C1S1_CEPFO|nr:DUF4219 domain-containing protein [Cephalotus follicularis]